MADTAHDAHQTRQAIAARGALAVIPNTPSRAQISLDEHLHAQRRLVECCFLKLKQIRYVATCFENTGRKLPRRRHSLQSSYGCDKCPRHRGFTKLLVLSGNRLSAATLKNWKWVIAVASSFKRRRPFAISMSNRS
jgi:hypothetical protein